MIRPECTATRETAPDLALGLLDGEERAAALEHVHRCPSCQAVVAELAGVADVLAQLAPEAEPPPGFGDRVVAVMRHDRRVRRRWFATIAAVAAAAVIGAVAVVRIVDAGRPAQQAAAPVLHSTSMRGADGLRVGRVVTTAGSPASAAVTVDYAIADGEYRLVVRWGNNITTPIGNMIVHDGRGSWTGPVANNEGTATLQMVDARGVVVCHAVLRI
jgi:anti-sigma factor RsiW